MEKTINDGLEECQVCFKNIFVYYAREGDKWESPEQWYFEVPKNCCETCFNKFVFHAAYSCGLRKVEK